MAEFCYIFISQKKGTKNQLPAIIIAPSNENKISNLESGSEYCNFIHSFF